MKVTVSSLSGWRQCNVILEMRKTARVKPAHVKAADELEFSVFFLVVGSAVQLLLYALSLPDIFFFVNFFVNVTLQQSMTSINS